MPTQCASTLLRSYVSGVVQNNGKLTHVYYQENNGSISVIYKNGQDDASSSWGGGDGAIVLDAGKALYHTPLATIHWQAGGRDEYRTYFLSPSFQICENRLSQPNDGGKWTSWVLPTNTVAAPISKLAAIVWLTGSSVNIRVYYQGNDDKIHELVFENGWQSGSVLPGTPLHGSSLAFVQRGNTTVPSIRGYYQENDLTLNEICWDINENWRLGTHIGATKLPYRTSIAATVPQGAEDRWMRVYYMGDGSKICEFWWSGGWHGPAVLPFASNSAIADANLAAVSFFRGDGFTDQPDVRIYVQQPYCLWTEVSCTKGTWTGSDGLRGVPIKIVPTA